MDTVTLARVSLCLALGTTSCADVWGFEDVAQATDGGASNALKKKHDAALLTVDSAIALGKTVDARTPSVGDEGDGVDASPPVVEAAAPPAETPDTGTGSGPPPVCQPECGGGARCVKAVGNVPVCVTAVSCTDSSACGPPCCVWLDVSSATGACQASGPPGPIGASCLCNAADQGKGGSCKSCIKPLEYPLASVEVCALGL